MNDTVSTLLALRYAEPDTALGIILGTGTNCALLERIDRWGGAGGWLAAAASSFAARLLGEGPFKTSVQGPRLNHAAASDRASTAAAPLIPAVARPSRNVPAAPAAPRITKLPAGYRGRSPEMVVNSEWGDFKDPCLPSLPEDAWVDCSSVNPGGQEMTGGGTASRAAGSSTALLMPGALLLLRILPQHAGKSHLLAMNWE